MSEKPYTDADVQMVARVLWTESGERTGQPTPICVQGARAALDALIAAGWRPPRPAKEPTGFITLANSPGKVRRRRD